MSADEGADEGRGPAAAPAGPSGRAPPDAEEKFPSDEEIAEYGESALGLLPGRDGRILWLAEFAMCSPLPCGWTVLEDHRGQGYYYEASSGRAQWHHPFTDEYVELVRRLRHAVDAANSFADGGAGEEGHEPPTLQEVAEMAAYLDFDVEAHARLAWIAWQCCIAPLPVGWRQERRSTAAREGQTEPRPPGGEDAGGEGEEEEEEVYVEVNTGTTCDHHPLDNVFRLLVAREKRILYADGDHERPSTSILSSLNEGPFLLSRAPAADGGGRHAGSYLYDFVARAEVDGAAREARRGPDAATPNHHEASRMPLSSRKAGTKGMHSAQSRQLARQRHGRAADAGPALQLGGAIAQSSFVAQVAAAVLYPPQALLALVYALLGMGVTGAREGAGGGRVSDL